VFIVGVALEATVHTLGVIPLFVSVFVLDTVGTTTHSTATTQALTLLNVVSVACQSSILQSFISKILSVHHTCPLNSAFTQLPVLVSVGLTRIPLYQAVEL